MEKYSSFRDPDGRVVCDNASVWRVVNADADLRLKAFLALGKVKDWLTDGSLISSEPGSADAFAAFTGEAQVPEGSAFYRHPRIDFPSFPFEWAPEMLHMAGKLTLDLASGLLPLGWGLKDATPYNILFQGSKPVFIDVLSFEKRDVENPIWLPYNQFVKTFYLPLLLNRKLEMPLKAIFQTNRDGVEVSEAASFFRSVSKLNPKIFFNVTLPNFLVKRAEQTKDLYKAPRKVSPEQAKFVLTQSLKRLRRQLDSVSPDRERKTKWTDYTKHNRETIPEYMRAKQEFVERTVSDRSPASTLDVGCNTGYFSIFAARAGSAVVALDHDPAVIGQLWRDVNGESLNVLPLVVDLSRPSPSLGWRYKETPSFLERAKGHFDLVMMLAVLHHMLVQERVPLREILSLAADLTKKDLIIEFVPPSDPLFQHLARGREHLHDGFNAEVFETTAKEFFEIVGSIDLPQTERRLYLMTKK